jgi:CheY-like chemotaxis protein
VGQEEIFVPGDALRKADILYVDPESQRRETMRRMLLSLGSARVQVAESGMEALKVVLGTPCNLIVTEHKMSPVDGIEFVREIRAASNYPRALVPALILGDPVGSDIISAAFEAGANLFLVKPLSAPKLYERLAWALADQRPFMLKDGHYLIRPGRAKLAQAALQPAATK